MLNLLRDGILWESAYNIRWDALSFIEGFLSFDRIYGRSEKIQMHRKSYVVTGGNSGVGYRLIGKLIKQAKVNRECPLIFIVCRNQAKAASAIKSLLTENFDSQILENIHDTTLDIHPSKWLVFVKCDLTNFDSVKEACARITKRTSNLNHLVLNAGVIPLSGIDWSLHNLLDLLKNPAWVLTTGGNFLKQTVHETTSYAS